MSEILTTQEMEDLTKAIKVMGELLEHLDYCGWGDAWERSTVQVKDGDGLIERGPDAYKSACEILMIKDDEPEPELVEEEEEEDELSEADAAYHRTWTTADGTTMLIAEMDDGHLVNATNFVIRKAKQDMEYMLSHGAPQFQGEIAQDIADNAEQAAFDGDWESFAHQAYHDLLDEVSQRNLTGRIID